MTDGRKDGKTDGSVNISLRNFVGEGIIIVVLQKPRFNVKKLNATTYCVKPSYGGGLINVCRQVNDLEILFVKGEGYWS